MRYNSDILYMTLKKEWFDKIRYGEKKEEYRELKRHWISRLKNPDNTWKSFSRILFRNGYSRKSDWIEVEFKGIRLGTCPYYSGQCIIIELGKVLDGSVPFRERGDKDKKVCE